jgi:hypothetical protein
VVGWPTAAALLRRWPGGYSPALRDTEHEHQESSNAVRPPPALFSVQSLPQGKVSNFKDSLFFQLPAMGTSKLVSIL